MSLEAKVICTYVEYEQQYDKCEYEEALKLYSINVVVDEFLNGSKREI